MAIQSYQVHTIMCDIPGCRDKKTANSIEALRGEGWTHIEIFSKEFEICPEHEIDLRQFFFDTSKS